MVEITIRRLSGGRNSWPYPDDVNGPESLTMSELMKRYIAANENVEPEELLNRSFGEIGADFYPDDDRGNQGFPPGTPGILKIVYSFDDLSPPA